MPQLVFRGSSSPSLLTYIYFNPNPANLYQCFTNAVVYKHICKQGYIKESKKTYTTWAAREWTEIKAKKLSVAQIEELITSYLDHRFVSSTVIINGHLMFNNSPATTTTSSPSQSSSKHTSPQKERIYTESQASTTNTISPHKPRVYNPLGRYNIRSCPALIRYTNDLEKKKSLMNKLQIDLDKLRTVSIEDDRIAAIILNKEVEVGALKQEIKTLQKKVDFRQKRNRYQQTYRRSDEKVSYHNNMHFTINK